MRVYNISLDIGSIRYIWIITQVYTRYGNIKFGAVNENVQVCRSHTKYVYMMCYKGTHINGVMDKR